MSWPCDDLGTDARKWFPQTMRKRASTSSPRKRVAQMLNTKALEKELRTFDLFRPCWRDGLWWGGCVRTVCWADTKTKARLSKNGILRGTVIVIVIVVHDMRGILGARVKVVVVRWPQPILKFPKFECWQKNTVYGPWGLPRIIIKFITAKLWLTSLV